MQPAAIITGTALVTPLGGDVDSTWENLLAGRAIRDHARVADASFQEVPFSRDPKGSASASATDTSLPFGSRLNNQSDSRVLQLARRASLIAGGGSPGPDALVVGTSKGEADAWIANSRVPVNGLGNLASQLGDELKIPGPRLTVSAACASGLQALIRGVLMIAAGDAQRVLVVAAESSLHPMFLENYRRLGVLAPKGARCRPFDHERRGFYLSEAAAAVMLEKSLHQAPAGALQEITVESFAFGSDATHLTGSDPSGQPLRNLLDRVAVGRRFDLIHAHGTGTVANDAVELQAIESVLPDPAARRPSLYSHKAALGHSLGAAGLVSVVLNVLMHRQGIIPANLNTHHPLASHRVSISDRFEQRPIRRSLAIAAGFGGAMAAVSLRSQGL